MSDPVLAALEETRRRLREAVAAAERAITAHRDEMLARTHAIVPPKPRRGDSELRRCPKCLLWVDRLSGCSNCRVEAEQGAK